MAKKPSNLKIARSQAEEAIRKINVKIEDLGLNTKSLCESLENLQGLFDLIRNVPSEQVVKYEEFKQIRLNWMQQAKKIESEYDEAVKADLKAGAAGVAAGVAFSALAPTAAMGIATTFGVASTGTAIAALHGAAATNAALAWLGGGALAAGGGGIAAGNALLVLAGPVGWAIAGVAFVGSSVMLLLKKNENDRIERIFTLISERDVKTYELAIVELNARIKRIIEESAMLNTAIGKIESFGTDYFAMNEHQQYELGAYVNLMNSTTQLLVNPIMALQPKYSEEDFDDFIKAPADALINEFKYAVVTLANLLFGIKLDKKDRKILCDMFKNNDDFLKAVKLEKTKIDLKLLRFVSIALRYKYPDQDYLFKLD